MSAMPIVTKEFSSVDSKIGKVRFAPTPLSPYLWMLIGSFAFACMGGLAHGLGRDRPWQVIAFMRSFVVLVMIATYAIVKRKQLVFLRPRVLWLRSIAGSFSLVGGFYALTRMPVSSVLTLTNTFPVWVAILSWPMLGTIPSARVWIAVCFGAIGVFLIQQPSLTGDEVAFWVAITCSLSTAVAMLGLHRLKAVDPAAVVVHFSAVSLIFVGIAFVCFDVTGISIAEFTKLDWVLLLGVGVSAAVGQVFLTLAFSHGDPARVSVVSLSQVIFGLLFDLTFFSDYDLGLRTVLGMALILFPTAWVMLERKTEIHEVEG
jgi:drug/metabolite transporter (DMT)-like permease